MPPSTKEARIRPYFRKIARFGLELLKNGEKQVTIQGKIKREKDERTGAAVARPAASEMVKRQASERKDE